MMDQSALPFVFLSHAHTDEEYVHRLMHDLQANGIAVWTDRYGIPVGTPDWEETIRTAIAHASAVVLVASPRARASLVVRDELDVALRHKLLVYPFWIDGEHWIESIPLGWGRTQYLDARHENYENARKELQALLQKQLRTPLLPVVLSPVQRGTHAVTHQDQQEQSVWSVPYRRNRFFTGREYVLQTLHEQLTATQQIAVTQAISGLGGVGKTQLAVEYAYRFRSIYRAVLWVRAETQETLLSDLANLATILDLPEQHEQEQIKMGHAVKRWLIRHSGWLLILDNVDDLQLVDEWIPMDHHGAVLLTTRQHETGSIAQAMELNVFTDDDDDGMLLLLKRAKRITSHLPLAKIEASEGVVARAITQQLGGLPLALDQAGAYIAETRCSVADYLHLLQQEQKMLLARRGTIVADHSQSVTTTFSLAFEQIRQKNEAAIELLKLCAYLAPDAIPLELITLGASHLGTILEPVAAEALKIDQTLETLQAYSLLRREGESHTLSIHRLVQVVLQDTLENSQKQLWTERTILAVNAAFPQVEHSNWPECERLLTHALLAAQYIETNHIVSVEAGRLLYETAFYLHERVRYAEAEPLYLRALQIREQRLGPHHLDVATSLNRLGVLYREQSKYASAGSLFQRALGIREQQLRPEHPDVAASLFGLAYLYFEQGRYAESEPLYQRSLAIREQQLGPQDPEVAVSLNNLGNLYYEQGRYNEGEPLYQRALRIFEQQLGPEHPRTALPLNNLANLYCMQGRYDEGEPLYQRALRIWEQQLGHRHPHVAAALGNLAELSWLQGNYAKAEPLYLRCLHIYEQVWGLQHPETAETLHDFARFHEAQGKSAEASIQYASALKVREQTLGTHHPKTTETRNRYIALLHTMGQHEEAARLEQETGKEEQKIRPEE